MATTGERTTPDIGPGTDEHPAAAHHEPAHPVRTFVLHFVEMVVAMVVGMIVLAPVWTFAFDRLGWTRLHDRPALHAMVMATDMTIAMCAWMKFRGHRWAPIVEMGGAMYAPFVVLLVPLWAGWISGGALMTLGHVLMLPAMVAVMLLRKDEYTGGHAHH